MNHFKAESSRQKQKVRERDTFYSKKIKNKK